MLLNGVTIEDTFAEAFPMTAARALGFKLGTEIKTEAGPLYQAHFGDRGW